MRNLRIEPLETRNCMSVLGATYNALAHTVAVQRSAGDTTTDYRVESLNGTAQKVDSVTVKLVPAGRAVAEVMASVPASTVVPPV